MSKDRALKLLDEMLSILDHAEGESKSSHTESHAHKQAEKPKEQQEKVQEDNFEWNYLKEVKDSMSGKTFRVTKDVKILEQAWKDSELGPNDELKPYCGAIGLCIQVEEDDNTLQLRWENMDTCWMPASACASAGDRKPTVPGFECDWLPPPGLEQYHEDEKNEEKKGIIGSIVEKVKEKVDSLIHGDVKEELFESVEDDFIKTNQHIQITHDSATLEKAWKEAELGLNDNLKPYLGCIGKIMQIEEDDDTVQLRWENLDTVWMPIKACFPAPNKPLSIPRLEADWLTPEGIRDEEEANNNNNESVEQLSANDEYYKKKQEEQGADD